MLALHLCGRGWKAATAKHMSLSHHCLKRFSAFQSLSLLGVFTLVHENTQKYLAQSMGASQVFIFLPCIFFFFSVVSFFKLNSLK